MELQGNGFLLRAWQQGDEVSLQHHADNAKVAAFLRDRFPHPYTLDDALFWINTVKEQQPLTSFAIIVNGEACGGIGIEPFNDESRITAEIGYWLSEQHWGKGIMTEALKLVTTYAFEHFALIRIEADVYDKNTASMRVLEKAGYMKEAVLRRSIIKNGEVMDKHMYAIFKED
ncbi:Protein N-acetyltransferase, RimJ/RimL family [Mucilaginibacter gossypiicola]|uniref:Protein N-acetyltransferase, RimJ/RimL family n=1 Tax=Mucilaginibacter gossypiicola TaxID=551995 RepID=A0A1H8CX40_9SPHI|nr:GNAT family protein [Mucilaginibacter gossypiicola]SEM99014.1 Protein N-acetyltransferase, RimJ/RimL family [Mucilaginibacter gossypiicola]